MMIYWVRSFIWATCVVLSLISPPIPLLASTDPGANSGQKLEPEKDLLTPDLLDGQPEPEDRLVILPEIKREGERFFLSSFKLPDKITFAGVQVPLDNWQVRERIEYEFYQFLEDQGESIILAKRTGRCFPPAERQLAENGLPDDLKYMLLVESKCISAAYSKAKASGPWQFIPSTGRRYRLKSDAVRDERRNLEMSTEAAVKYLKYLKDFQDNDWFLAMASYNAGEERIRKLLKEQKITDYWKMHGPRETMRYVPRIIAAKEIYSQPEKYLGLTKKDLYMPLETETITVHVKESQRALASVAEEFGTYLLEIKMLNPEFKKDMLPRGSYQIRVPRQTCPNRCFKQDPTPDIRLHAALSSPSPIRPFLHKLLAAGLAAADPHQALLKTVSLNGASLRIGQRSFDLSHTKRVIAVGAGKASARMAQALEIVLGERLDDGLVIVKTGHSLTTKRMTVLEAGHPIPNRAGLVATQRLLRLTQSLSPRDLLIVLLSGGASSLLPAPVSDVTLADKQRTTQLLLRCGATINEVNVVRKHLSLIKGGGLAASTNARIITLVLSDVIGDDLGSIGSGPTAADPSTFTEAIEVLQRYQIWPAVPSAVRRYLQRGQKGAVPETLKPGTPRGRSVHHHIIGSNHIMLEAVERVARDAGLFTKLVSSPLTGEARVAAKQLVELGKTLRTGRSRVRRPYCVVAGGETTVTVTGHGKGGRAQEFAAAAAFELSGLSNAWIVALGSDGTDGPTKAAGALVSSETVSRTKRLKVDLQSALNRHNTYPALKSLDAIFTPARPAPT